MKIVGWFEVVDDYGQHLYTVSQIGKRGHYYFTQRTLLGNHRMRYNKIEECVEELLDSGKWDVYSVNVYQTRFIPYNT